MKTSAVVLAAGRGERFGGERNKVWTELSGSPLLQHTLHALSQGNLVEEVIVVARPGEESEVAELLQELATPAAVVPGGERRADSALAGIEAARGEFVLIHDGARPLVTVELLRRVLAAAVAHGAAVPVLPVVDTLRRVSNGYFLPEPVPRENLVRVQTPQGFRRSLVLAAYHHTLPNHLDLPDDAAAVLAFGHPVAVVPGDPRNVKVTHLEDLALVSRLLGSLPK